MYNLHCHSLLSDGVLVPSELAVRFAARGYKVIAITDHADYSNIDAVSRAIVHFCRRWPSNAPIAVLPGIELTHVMPQQFKPLCALARKRGIKVVIGHGETVVEPVIPGTNRAALEAEVDILAHPGRITKADALLAARKGIFLELTSRCGHNRTNAHVARMALACKAPLIINMDAHEPGDILAPAQLAKVGLRAGLSRAQLAAVRVRVGKFVRGELGVSSRE